MREAVIVDAIRTPIGKGKPGGMLSGWHPSDLLGEVLGALVRRSGIDPARVDDVIVGCVSQSGEQSFNVARNAVLAAGLPVSVPATTVDRQCGSSQQAIHFAAQGIMAGAYDVAIAAGVESMSRVPMFSSSQGADPVGPRATERFGGRLVPQGVSAEMIAAKWSLSRGDLDNYSVESHRRAARAAEAGLLAHQILPISSDRGDGDRSAIADFDEGVRPNSTREALAGLSPAFYSERLASEYPKLNWVVTAAGSSQLSDGAAGLLLMERAMAEGLGLPVRAVVRAFSVIGDDPVLMLTGVIPATEKVLANAGLTIGDIDLFEVNEAFAPVVLAWQSETGAELAKVNIFGGAIANGHPLGATGAKLMTALINGLEHTGGRFGLQTICEGGGMANAIIIERIVS